MAFRSFLAVFALVILNTLWFASRAYAQDHGQSPLRSTERPKISKHRIAIIGAGAGGSSAAYHLSKFYNETSQGLPIEIDVFESNYYVGGRTTTVKALDDPRYSTELGASIFVTVNHVLYNLSRDFDLSTKDKLYESTGSMYDLGVWDGSSFVFTIANDNSDDSNSWKGRWKGYWDIAKLLWKYGLSPIRTQRAKNSVVSSFLRMYDEYFPIASLTNFAAAVGLSEYTGITGEAALLKNSVSEQFSREIVQSSTRVNYAQNLNQIHGLETMVCMAIEGAMSIDGGNWQIFDEAVKRSGAKLHLNTTVTDISQTEQGSYQLQTSNDDTAKEYDTVILASPYQFSNITFTPPLPKERLPKKIDYVTLHVTLFTSPYRPNPAFFGLDSQDQVPDSILTTLPTTPDTLQFDPSTSTSTSPPPRGAQAVGPTHFWSLSTLRVLNPQWDPFPPSTPDADLVLASKLPHATNSSHPTAQKQYLYKIFSPVPLTASFLSDLFAFNSTASNGSVSTLPGQLVPWSHTKTWHSYPYLPPTASFSDLLLDSPFEGQTERFNAQTQVQANWMDAYGVFYTSAVESFISTMETSALMGRNVARVVIDGIGLGLDRERATSGEL